MLSVGGMQATTKILWTSMLQLLLCTIFNLFGSCVSPVTFLMGIYLVFQGNLGLDTVVFLSGITGILAEGIRSFSQFVQFVQGGFVSLARVYELLDLQEEDRFLTKQRRYRGKRLRQFIFQICTSDIAIRRY